VSLLLLLLLLLLLPVVPLMALEPALLLPLRAVALPPCRAAAASMTAQAT
jgi:hypothetical protein